MKGSAKLSLAITLALAGGNVFALGLGTIQVRSKLNQPLDAVIPVIVDSPAEASGLEVALASAEDFQRVGLDKSRVDVPLEFSVGTDRGQTVVHVTTKDIVREPLVDFLVVANWPKGKLLREYTVLLDPPMMAPAAGTATLSPAHEAPRAKPQPLAPEREHAAAKPTHVKTPRTESPAPAKPAAAKPAPAARTAGSGEYGPVAAGETLSEIAGATRPDDKTNLDAMMLALLKANPNAFYRDNINALKRGAILRIPSADEIKAGGNAAAVAAAVREQNQAWASNAPVAKPTLVAKTGAPKAEPAATKPTKPPAASAESHLALVPPGAGKGKQNSSDHPGAASGSGNAQTTAELARTREALTSREQEVTDLKSRVKDLEKMNDDGKRLLSLKQNEIAELQNKLKQLEAAAAAKPAAVVAVTPPAKPAEAKPEATKPAPVAAANAGDATASKENAKLTAKDIWGDINAGEKPAENKAAAPGAAATPPAGAVATPPQAEAKPVETTPAATAAAVPPAVEPPKPTEAAPAEHKSVSTPAAVKPPVPTKVEPIKAPALPWWQDNNVLMAGGAALLIIGLLALMRFMRKPKLPATVAGAGATADEHFDAMPADEQHLLDQLAQHPGDAALSLQLLDLYYAQGDASRFEAAAEAMYAHIADPTSAEWQQVRAMGEHLCPHNPLFGGDADIATALHDAHNATEHAGHEHMHADDQHSAHIDGGDFHTQQMPLPAEEHFDFDLADHTASVHSEPAHAEPAPAYAPTTVHAETPAAKPAEDFFSGEDAIGTKLDLAKAYLDMGDPEGARSMLDEVMAEGNDAQKGEARKLLAEIG
ncbi:MAG: fimbrial protein FimV [Proteobacteria bacterium]|nr:fimbrial protein FimV [Pseudomonadota bacterium]